MVSAKLPGLLLIAVFTVCHSNGEDVCPLYYSEIAGRCYRYFLFMKSYDEAETLCHDVGGDVAHVEDSVEWWRSQNRSNTRMTNFWIKSYSNMAFLKEWSSVDDIQGNSRDRCVLVRKIQTVANVFWERCYVRRFFICETLPLGLSGSVSAMVCPSNGTWDLRDIGAHSICYKTSEDKMSYEDALDHCRRLGGSLANPKFEHKYNDLLAYAISTPGKKWIGLRGTHRDSMAFSDNTIVPRNVYMVRSYPHNKLGPYASPTVDKRVLCEAEKISG